MNRERRRGRYISPHGSKTWEYLSIFACTLLILSLGIVLGWNSPMVVLLSSPDSPIHDNKLDISTLTALLSTGQMLAPVINVLVTDKIGRKYTILLCSLPLVASWSIILMTKSAYMWYVARFLSGISVGVGFVVAPIYLGEISSVKTRGANGTMISIMCNIGILVSFIIVPYYSIRNTTASFIFLSICFVFLFSFIPESPYYLAMRGRMEEAEETLQKLRGRIDVSDELTKIDQFIKKEENNKIRFWSTLKDIFTIRRHRRAFFIIFLLTFNNFFSSYLPLIFYGQLIFKEILSTVSDYTINIVAGITLLLSSIVTGCFVDRLGRKLIILVSGIIVGICDLTISSYFYAKDFFNIDVSSYFLIPIIASISSIFFCNLGFCSILSIMMSEVFAAEVKVLSTCILGIIGGILAMINDQLYILLAISLNYGHGLPFFGFCLLVWLSTALLYHFSLETKGKTFIEIQRELQD
ncbi:facilitated trehalose transporter Tret1-like isoform X2 [Polistes fuscatus]|uniref:facilitated trehalose transporter Tret1-like isoform X1 n=1 Tax=Polistes fuscatus TaxID=30207 RepID=UPI001CA90B43|nr:facilitated trehalose transporter Tret1-like isoform X1 [Polistes fuscatus]XP_043502757.1 facilitated trehalose transporter Tret1-like isoform X1 [Polistes fuscatus]XP_043506149.1 facilitated trehalose transporter Tret1-like isoform X2 [Polistes fuscatus]